MDYTISVDANLVDTLNNLAAAQSQTAEEYAGLVIGSHLAKEYKDGVIKKIAISSVADVQQYDTAIMAVAATIAAAQVAQMAPKI
jgi:hypothetical protein